MSFACSIAFATYPSGVWNTFPDGTPVVMNGSITHPWLNVAPGSASVDGIDPISTSHLTQLFFVFSSLSLLWPLQIFAIAFATCFLSAFFCMVPDMVLLPLCFLLHCIVYYLVQLFWVLNASSEQGPIIIVIELFASKVHIDIYLLFPFDLNHIK